MAGPMPLLADAELEKACSEWIICERQPGCLRISKRACAKRFLLAQRLGCNNPDDEFQLALQSGLAICRNCPYGRIFSERYAKEGSAT